MDSELQNTERWSLILLSILCVFVMCYYHKNSVKILNSYQKCWIIWSSSSLLMSLFLTPYHPPTVLDPHLRTDWPAPSLGLVFLILFFGVSLLTDQHPSSLFFSFLLVLQVHAGTALCGLHTKIDKGVPLNTLTLVKNAKDKMLFGHLSMNTRTYTH